MLTDERIDDLAWGEFEGAMSSGVSVDNFKRLAKTVRNEVRKEQADKIAELTDALQFVERWAVHHGSKANTSAESALGVIQHYPPIAAITASYADGKTPDTFNPFAKIAELERAVRYESDLCQQAMDARKELEKQLAEARNALLSINQYGSDTLSGMVNGPDDRKWQRDAVLEMTGRAYAAIKAKEQPNE